jgi:hypothetical protein
VPFSLRFRSYNNTTVAAHFWHTFVLFSPSAQ